MNTEPPDDCTVCILAGGQSRRMGRDKSGIVVEGKTLIDRVRTVASTVSPTVIVIRKDSIENCGPLSGVLTGLNQSETKWTAFLSCDMPLLSTETLRDLIVVARQSTRAAFVSSEEGVGFPFAIASTERQCVQNMIANGKRSLRELASETHAIEIKLPVSRKFELFNANTPEEISELKKLINSIENGAP